MWWSRGFGGASALDYLIEVRGDPFTKAMEKILGQEAETPSLFITQEISFMKLTEFHTPKPLLCLHFICLCRQQFFCRSKKFTHSFVTEDVY